MLSDLERLSFIRPGLRILLIGAGGASRGVLLPLLSLDLSLIHIFLKKCFVFIGNFLLERWQNVSDKDKALLQELCFGVLRTLSQLDWLINKLMARPMTGKQRTVHYLMMVGLDVYKRQSSQYVHFCVRGCHPVSRAFPDASTNTHTDSGSGLLPVRSPLLGESRLISFPRGT